MSKINNFIKISSIICIILGLLVFIARFSEINQIQDTKFYFYNLILILSGLILILGSIFILYKKRIGRMMLIFSLLIISPYFIHNLIIMIRSDVIKLFSSSVETNEELIYSIIYSIVIIAFLIISLLMYSFSKKVKRYFQN